MNRASLHPRQIARAVANGAAEVGGKVLANVHQHRWSYATVAGCAVLGAFVSDAWFAPGEMFQPELWRYFVESPDFAAITSAGGACVGALVGLKLLEIASEGEPSVPEAAPPETARESAEKEPPHS